MSTEFSVLVGKKKFHAARVDATVTVHCQEHLVRIHVCDTVAEAELVYETILDTLNDVGEHFD